MFKYVNVRSRRDIRKATRSLTGVTLHLCLLSLPPTPRPPSLSFLSLSLSLSLSGRLARQGAGNLAMMPVKKALSFYGGPAEPEHDDVAFRGQGGGGGAGEEERVVVREGGKEEERVGGHEQEGDGERFPGLGDM